MEKKNMRNLIFLINVLNCSIGGMEIHQRAFIEYYKTSAEYRLYVVEKLRSGIIVYMTINNMLRQIALYESVTEGLQCLCRTLTGTSIIFANDFWWLDMIPTIKKIFHNSKIYIRSGGNDIEKMPWNPSDLPYEERHTLCVNTLNQIDGIIVNSHFTQTRFISHGIPTEKTIIIRGGVNITACRFIVNNREMLNKQMRRILSITSPYIFAFVCRFVPFKGIELALEAIRKSWVRNKCHLLFVGDGELKDELVLYCNIHSLRASFLGALPNETVLQIMGASDLLFNTSLEQTKSYKDHSYIHTETMGRSMMEAISVHTPIIATNVGGTSELFDENEDIGILADCSSEAVNNAIQKALNHNFIFKINKDYSWNNIFNLYTSIFNA